MRVGAVGCRRILGGSLESRSAKGGDHSVMLRQIKGVSNFKQVSPPNPLNPHPAVVK